MMVDVGVSQNSKLGQVRVSGPALRTQGEFYKTRMPAHSPVVAEGNGYRSS